MQKSRDEKKKDQREGSWLKRKLKEDRKNRKEFLLDLAIIPAVLFFFLSAGCFLEELRGMLREDSPSLTYMQQLYQEEGYAQIAQYTLSNIDMKNKKDLQEYTALGTYYIDSLLLSAARAKGDQEEIQKQTQNLEKEKQKMGSLQKAASEMDAMLN